MKRSLLLTCTTLLCLFCGAAFAQTKITGSIKDENDEGLAGVNIIVKGRVIGTVTDLDGNFNLSVADNPPITLVISFVGYATQEAQITNANTTGLNVKMEETTILGQEVVVSASRVEEKIMESPVSIEKMDILAVQTTPADNYYKGLANLKGVDVTTSSINFQIINTRGFGSTGNTRFVQLIDGMDTQAPALNFPIGNLNGPSELDVESCELIPGASSALYGPSAFNGVLLVNSKNAFDYQGLSAFAKSGVNHISDPNAPASPIWEGALRYAKAFKNKFAFKVNGSFMKALDWYGVDGTDREVGRTPAGFPFNPGSDRLHYMGDEAAIPLSILRFSRNGARPGWETIATSAVFESGLNAWDYSQSLWLPSHVVSVSPYAEKDVIDYNAKNMKVSGGLYYRINDKLELSYLYNAGFGTSIYTGAQRYSLKNFGIQQHRLQLRGDNFYVRGYTTRENSGESYIVEFLSKRLNDLRSGGGVSNWLGKYGVEYLRYLYGQGYGPNATNPAFNNPSAVPVGVQIAAHQFARTETESDYPLAPGTPEFESAKAQALKGVVPDGPSFQDATNLYHVDGQFDFKNQVKFMELQTGASYRLYDLNSNGTIFDDKTRDVTITEYGVYAQAGKWLGDRKVKIGGSIRYDKNQNFKPRVNPRVSAVLKLNENNNIRLSYQTGFRFPTTQGQHIDLSIISARLIGGLPYYADKYKIVRNSTVAAQPVLSYTGESVQAFRNEVFATNNMPAAIAKLVPYTAFDPVRPEKVQSIEAGYKGVIDNNFMIDFAFYYNIYNDFITQTRVVTAQEYTTNPAKNGIEDDQFSYTTDGTLNGTPNYLTILNGTAMTITSNGIEGNTANIYSNYAETITSQGAVIGLTYSLLRGYLITGNYNWNAINNSPSAFYTEFNTPAHKVNLGFGNRKLTDRLGFNINMRWQSEFEWQSSFTIPANGKVPSYKTVDAQISYRIPSLKSVVKIGGSNLLNTYYIQSLGGPGIGAIYYVSLTFDEVMR